MKQRKMMLKKLSPSVSSDGSFSEDSSSDSNSTQSEKILINELTEVGVKIANVSILSGNLEKGELDKIDDNSFFEYLQGLWKL